MEGLKYFSIDIMKMAEMQMDMTAGEPGKVILTFIRPIIAGNIFQQFYSMADTVIVGRCLGVEALAAVGATGTITGLLLGFLMGFTSGLALPCSRFFGAKDIENLKKGVANAILISLAVTVPGTLLSVAVIGGVLHLVNTPPDIYHMAKEYITVICSGFLCMVAYNMCASVLRAVGNSRTPLQFLVLSSGLNIALDFLFILGFGWGVAGAAYATVLSQGTSAVLCIVYIMKKVPVLHLAGRHFKPDFVVIGIQLKNAVPMALQYSVTALGSVFLQSSLNLFGSTAVAGYTAAVKIECIVTQPYPALGMTMASFSAQNKGKGDRRRIQAGVKAGFCYCLLYSMAAVILVNLLLPYIITFFVAGQQQAETAAFSDSED